MTEDRGISPPPASQHAEEEFFSQFGEDALLWNFFGKKPEGFFVEIGAFDGVFLSPTYWFERHGWKGICLEPHPDYFPLCVKNRPGSVCVRAACVGDERVREIPFYAEPSGLFSVLGEHNKDVMRQRFVDAWGKELKSVRKVDVPAKTINTVLRDHLPENVQIDFISIDVEGVETEVLRGFDAGRYRPRVLVIETNSDVDREAVSTHLAQFGYREARRLYVNTFYVRTEEDAKLLQSIFLDYKTARRLHPAGASFTPLAQASGEYRSERAALLQQWSEETQELKEENSLLRAELTTARAHMEQKEAEIHALKAVADERLQQMIEKEELIRTLSSRQAHAETTKGETISLARWFRRLFGSSGKHTVR